MKRLCLLLIVLAILGFSACTAEAGNRDTSECGQTASNSRLQDSAESGLSVYETHDRKYLTGSTIPRLSLDAEEGAIIDLPEVGLEKVVVNKKTEGYPTDFKDYPLSTYTLNYYPYSSFLVVETGSEILIKELEHFSFVDYLYLCDIDGDGLDEIVIHQGVDMTGTLTYQSRVFKVIDNEIKLLFDSFIINPSTGLSRLDTGFASTFADGFIVKIENRITGYSLMLDFSVDKRYLGWFFDETGKVILSGSGGITCSTFQKFEPTDVDGDGVFEIVCLQIVSLHGTLDFIGQASTVLKYNPQTQEFEVIEAEFIPRGEISVINSS